MPKQNVGKEESSNPLLQKKEIRPPRNWHEFLALWEATQISWYLESLLHKGFTTPLAKCDFSEKEYDNIDRLIFYFSVADGWADCHPLDIEEDKRKKFLIGYDQYGNSSEKTPGEIRQQLARKAFDMLCSNLFRMELRGSDGKFVRNWREGIVSERLFPAIQRFFRTEKRVLDTVGIHNLPHQEDRIHNEQHVISFLLNLVKFIWEWEGPKIGYYSDPNEEKQAKIRVAAIRARIDAAKPWTIEVLSWLEKLDMLREWIFKFDKPCLAKLKEIAFRNKFSNFRDPVREDRSVVSLDEACFLDSKAGWLLKEYELKMREEKRLKEISEAKRKKEEADQKIKKLSGMKE